MLSNRKTTLGGALSAFGTFLSGAGVTLHISSDKIPDSVVMVLIVAGFIIQGFGVFFGALFAADASTVSDIAQQVHTNTQGIAAARGDTAMLNTAMLRRRVESPVDNLGAKP